MVVLAAGTLWAGSPFPALPPDPYQSELAPLPPLDEELWFRGGSYLYEPEGDRLGWPESDCDGHVRRLRLPEDYCAPQPLTLFADFLGADPIRPWPRLAWPGCEGYQWEPRLVGYGSYQMFGLAFEENGARRDGVGHQLLLDFDLRLTGTERIHVQFRPLGEKNTGGSLYQINEPDGYIDNSTGVPDRAWIELEVASVLGGLLADPFVPRDYHVVMGRFPMLLQNSLLLNDDVVGLAVNQNTIHSGPLSNVNLQGYYAGDEVDAFDDSGASLVGMNAFVDYRHAFIELNFAAVDHNRLTSRDTQYLAGGVTKFFGPLTLAGRALCKFGDAGGRGDGQLFVLETNWTRAFDGGLARAVGVQYAVFYVDAFRSTSGWNSISGGNFDRLRSAFSVNPLVALSAARDPQDTTGVSLGVQLFRCDEDESITPELAYETPGGTSVWGFGFTWQRKTGRRTYFDLRGVVNWSDDPTFRREGIMLSEFIVF